MSLTYAVDRLYEIGWLPEQRIDLDRLPDGRRYPTLSAIQRIFTELGLRLSVKQNQKYRCYQAVWSPAGEPSDPARPADERHGTVVGSCDREAAVYALAQLLAAQAEAPLATA
jgi:hypothetical protein